MKVSIVIACKKNNPYLEECLKHCLQLDYPDYEILVLPDEGFSYTHPRIRIIPTGEITPPAKRNKVLGIASGELLAFIDDDAYPEKNWLKRGRDYFHESEIAAIGGPAITPQEDSLRQFASGLVYESFLVSDGFTYRYRPEKIREVDDYPSCNFIVRREIFEALGGFKTNFWPGEDTFLCLEISKKFHKKILYVPEAIVYHHRRHLFFPHLKQVSHYALHRGYFAKRFPETSLRLSYFIPSLFFLILIFSGFMGLFYQPFKFLFLSFISFYLLVIFFFSIFKISPLRKRCELFFLLFLGIILTHFIYGIYFLKGLFSKKMKEEK
ncbi:MAG: glycosyltransferase [Candidatus Omnitrophica bacterium]|nr:glycosyltransferase [Candidatus Omnitrophota bacterium]MCM8793316.1 glycosyltransferase [Candidatus Omnitrophota bacterium]